MTVFHAVELKYMHSYRKISAVAVARNFKLGDDDRRIYRTFYWWGLRRDEMETPIGVSISSRSVEGGKAWGGVPFCKGVDCSTISHTVYTMYCRPQYGWYIVN